MSAFLTTLDFHELFKFKDATLAAEVALSQTLEVINDIIPSKPTLLPSWKIGLRTVSKVHFDETNIYDHTHRFGVIRTYGLFSVAGSV